MKRYEAMNNVELSDALYHNELTTIPYERSSGQRWLCRPVPVAQHIVPMGQNIYCSDQGPGLQPSWRKAALEGLRYYAPQHDNPENAVDRQLKELGVSVSVSGWEYECGVKGGTPEEASRNFIQKAEQWTEKKREKAILDAWNTLSSHPRVESLHWDDSSYKLSLKYCCVFSTVPSPRNRTKAMKIFDLTTIHPGRVYGRWFYSYAVDPHYASFLMIDQLDALQLWEDETWSD